MKRKNIIVMQCKQVFVFQGLYAAIFSEFLEYSQKSNNREIVRKIVKPTALRGSYQE